MTGRTAGPAPLPGLKIAGRGAAAPAADGVGRGAPPPTVARVVQEPELEADKSVDKPTTVALPIYVHDLLAQRKAVNPRDTTRTLILTGLKAIGLDIREEDIEPRKKGPPKRR